jgi:peptidoglycan/xylan/chitin deacetylase (PgdA/CDA1 family)
LGEIVRADAFITLNVVQPVCRLFPPKGRRVPILMYHSISDREERGHPYFRTVTSPKVFSMHMEYLKECGYTAVSVAEALDYIDGKKVFATQPVVITFDDGFADFHTGAFPVLAEHGLTATMYLPTGFIRREPGHFSGWACLTWNQVRELHAAGIEFGSHTVNHPKLVELPAKAVEEEVRRSKEAIEQEIGAAVTSFAYPYAFPETKRSFTAMLRGMLQEAGYGNGTCTVIGLAGEGDDRLFLKRLPMNGLDDGSLMGAKLGGAYDWLGRVQRGWKRLKANKRPTASPPQTNDESSFSF